MTDASTAPYRGRQTLIGLGIAVVVIVGASFVGMSALAPSSSDDPTATSPAQECAVDAPYAPPEFGSARVASLPADERPPAPTQWAVDGVAPPTGQWWSSALVGPGTEPLWAHPLAGKVNADGTVALSQRPPTPVDDGITITPFEPALTIEPRAAAAPSITGSGEFHVTLRVGEPDDGVELSLVQGSPFAELAFAQGPATFRGIDAEALDQTRRTLRLRSQGEEWIIGSDVDVTWAVDGDVISATPDDSAKEVRLAVGPVPADASIDWTAEAVAIAEAPVQGTIEETSVDDLGMVTQTLRVDRESDTALWALLPHQQAFMQDADTSKPIATMQGPRGTLPVHRLGKLVLQYPATPISWSTLSPADGPSTDQLLANLTDDRPDESNGSYFGGKLAGFDATLADLAASADNTDVRDQALQLVSERLGRLIDGTGPAAGWNGEWGSVVVTPAEFGSGSELSDHHLQYGYWVAAAATLAEHDQDWAATHGAFIDALVNDYAGTGADTESAAGTDTDPCTGSLPTLRSWNPFEGHSYASGLAPFADGNNLESTSEAIQAWWAAARWYTSTGRPDLAERFIARYTIESALARTVWLDRAPDDPTLRPWIGILWSAKTDLNTWFDPAPESALGIQLLPIGPSSLARYPDEQAIDGARRRWDWCATNGGCTDRWANLLSSDAMVAGVDGYDAQVGEAEPSTSASVLNWWGSLWADTQPVAARCTPGAIVRRASDGSLVVLASNPSHESAEMRCELDGQQLWAATLDPGDRQVNPI